MLRGQNRMLTTRDTGRLLLLRGRDQALDRPTPVRTPLSRGPVARLRGGRAGAFTVVEAAVWLALLATVSWIGAASLQGMALEVRVNRAAREAASLLEWARWESIRSGTVHRIEVDTEQETLAVFAELRGEEAEDETDPEVRRLDLRERFPGVVLAAADRTCRTSGTLLADRGGVHLVGARLRFHPTGTADRAGSIYFMPEADLPDRRDRMFALSVLLAAGRVQLWRFDPWKESDGSGEGAWVSLY